MLIDILKLKNEPYKTFYMVRINETGHHSRQFSKEDDAMNCVRIINDVLEEEGYEITEVDSKREECIYALVAKKKVYVLTSASNEDESLEGVFSTEEIAKKYAEEERHLKSESAERSGNHYDAYTIYPATLDNPNEK
jgi:hypothetical protein